MERNTRFDPAFPLDQLVPWDKNPRKHDEADVIFLMGQIAEFGITRPFLAQSGTNRIIAGHGALLAAKRLNLPVGPVRFIAMTDDEYVRAVVADNRAAELSRWDYPNLKDILGDLSGQGIDLATLGWTDAQYAEMLVYQPPAPLPGAGGNGGQPPAPSEEQIRRTLAEQFGAPPFSIFDARQGYWQARKAQWLALGIESELGRGGNIVPNGTERPASQDGAYQRKGRGAANANNKVKAKK